MTSVEKVKELCKERKISICKLERDLQFGNGYIGQLKKGSFPDDRLCKIADYFGVSVDYLMGKENAPADGEDVLQDLKDDERALLHSYRTMTDQQRKMMSVFIKGLKDVETEIKGE